MAFKFNNETPAKIIYRDNGVDQSLTAVKYRYNNQDIVVWTAFTSQDFNYDANKKIQSFKIPATGTYELEVWGAQGGNAGTLATGGLGGHAKGRMRFNEDDIIYIVIGTEGEDAPLTGSANYTKYAGGYNGGGFGCTSNQWVANAGGGGGGATHIATTNRGELKNYASYKNNNEILIVAGGGGGAITNGGGNGWNGGSGGGETGGDGQGDQASGGGKGGTQTTGYAFGKGDDALHYDANGYPDLKNSVANNSYGGAGSGGGYYGGYVSHADGAGGGSGYIINTMTNTVNEKGKNTGNGKAKITLILD